MHFRYRFARLDCSGMDCRTKSGNDDDQRLPPVMLDIRWIRENPEAFDGALKNRGQAPAAAHLLALDEARRAAIQKLQDMQTRRNAISKEIGQAKANKDMPLAETLMGEVAALKHEMAAAQEEERTAAKALDDALAVIPNVPLEDVPVGPNESANVEIRKWGEPRRVNWAKEHFELGEALGQMDFETAAKLSGSRFVVLKKSLARMERALGQFMLDLHTEEHGYTEVQPPLLVKDEVLFGTGQLPKFEEDQYRLTSARLKDRGSEEIREMLNWSTVLQNLRLAWIGRGCSEETNAGKLEAIAHESTHDIEFACQQYRSAGPAVGSSRPPKSRSPISCASRSSPRTSCRSASPRSRPASAPRPGRRGRTRVACCASTSSTRWSLSRSPRQSRARKSTSA